MVVMSLLVVLEIFMTEMTCLGFALKYSSQEGKAVLGE